MLRQTGRLGRAVLAIVGIGLLLASGMQARAGDPFFFIQLSDPQFGMFAQNADSRQETANFEFAIATANRLQPAFVIVTGDLVNRSGDKDQTAEYLRIAAKLDRSIPLYNVPGNHDLGNDPTPATIAAYTALFGPEHYSFRIGSMKGIVLNSCLIQSPKGESNLGKEQDDWLKDELEKARQERESVILFQHHPWFVENIDEPDGYHNLPVAQRRRYFDLFQQYGVTHVFAGHYHANKTAKYGDVEMVTTGAVGKPLRKDVSGMRIVIVRDTAVEHRFYHLGEIPNQIDL